MDINTIGALRVAQAVLPGMRARGRGRLLFMSSIAGRIVPPRQAAYAATKWALEALVEALAIEAGPLGVEAALLEPGPVSSGALDHVTTYTLPHDPYTHLPGRGGTPASQMTPEEVAAGTPTRQKHHSCPCASPSAGSPPRSWPHAGPHPTTARSSPAHPRRPAVNGKGRLTELVRPLLVAAPAGRIINVVSWCYSRKLDLDNLQGEQQHSYFGAYSASKLGKVLFTTELARASKAPGDRRVGQPRSRQDKLQQTVGRDGPGGGRDAAHPDAQARRSGRRGDLLGGGPATGSRTTW